MRMSGLVVSQRAASSALLPLMLLALTTPTLMLLFLLEGLLKDELLVLWLDLVDVLVWWPLDDLGLLQAVGSKISPGELTGRKNTESSP